MLGGDGFCGWPTSLYLSDKGHDVVIVGNLSRPNIDNQLEVGSLTPISPISVRRRAWKNVSGKELGWHQFDVADNCERLLSLIQEIPVGRGGALRQTSRVAVR